MNSEKVYILFASFFINLLSQLLFVLGPSGHRWKLNLHKTSRRCPEGLLNVSWTFNFGSVSRDLIISNISYWLLFKFISFMIPQVNNAWKSSNMTHFISIGQFTLPKRRSKITHENPVKKNPWKKMNCGYILCDMVTQWRYCIHYLSYIRKGAILSELCECFWAWVQLLF